MAFPCSWGGRLRPRPQQHQHQHHSCSLPAAAAWPQPAAAPALPPPSLLPPPPPQQQQQQQQRRPRLRILTCSSSNSNGPPAQHGATEPWALMGRVLRAPADIDDVSRQRLVLLAAASKAGISPQEMEARLADLVALLPDLASLLPSLNPAALAGLAEDTSAVANKLIRLRLLFPSADVSQMISRRPTLLLDEEFGQVEAARAKLQARLLRGKTAGGGSSGGGGNVLGTTLSAGSSSSSSSSPLLDGLVSRQPLLLVEDVDALLDELQRLLPAVDVVAALVRDPDLVTQVMCNRRLSIWLMPGVAVLPLLQSNPDVLYMVQRGKKALGPGAEFMGAG